ncbi:MAG: type II secretion system F family protein [Candidatus Omnitrophica bacterium]|nr:type II secretion system F family protein [Candidatus Omnitrophota bacterium]
MATFLYRARDKRGTLLTGAVEAEDEAFVLNKLKQAGNAVVAIEKQTQAKVQVEGLLNFIQKVRPQDILLFTRQLATLLKSGISLTSAVMSIREQTKNKIMRDVLEQINKDIQGGVSLSDSLAKHPDVFSEFFVSMIKVGETGGILEEVLDRLVQLGTQDLEINSRIKSAVSYPIILVVVAVIVVSFIMISIIPKFVTIFETYEAKLPFSTNLLLGASLAFRKTWYLLLAAMIGFVFWLRNFMRKEEGKYKIDSMIVKLPLIGPLYLKVVIAQFARTLGGLVRSGVAMVEALTVTEKTVANLVIKKIIRNVRDSIIKGESLSEPFKASGIFPVMVIQMISIGEKTGKLEQMLFDVAEFYDREIEYAIRNMTAVLEPMLLLIMGSMVAFIALSVLLPIFNLIKVFKH